MLNAAAPQSIAPLRLSSGSLFAEIENRLRQSGGDIAAEIALSSDLYDALKQECRAAFQLDDASAEARVHRLLYQVYLLHSRVPGADDAMMEGALPMETARRMIEQAFLDAEEAKLDPAVFAAIPADADAFSPWLVDLIEAHPAARHPLFEDFLPNQASAEDLRFLLVQESAIDAGTDDFLALMQVGAPMPPKLEIAANYWDEMGNGDAAKIHSHLFKQALSAFKIDNDLGVEDLEAEALACGNLQLMLSLSRRHFYEAAGYFAAVEHLAPRRFVQLLAAWERNGISSIGSAYHSVHVDIDVEHAKTWLLNVVRELAREGRPASEAVTRGVLYRLNTSQSYLDRLLAKLHR